MVANNVDSMRMKVKNLPRYSQHVSMMGLILSSDVFFLLSGFFKKLRNTEGGFVEGKTFFFSLIYYSAKKEIVELKIS